MRKRWRDYGFRVGLLETGPLNAITDVPGVMVGHSTIIQGEGPLIPGKGPIRTGVTAILPHGGNLFREKVRAAIHVINGFGKATGIAQVQELGVLETPIILTNTLSVGIAWDSLCQYMLDENPEIGVTAGTVNPVVLECNDGFLNDIRGRHVKKEHVFEAISQAKPGPCPEGNVGAGTGMSCLGFKGGIGTSSRIIREKGIDGNDIDYIVGVLVLANFGRLEDLLISGMSVGKYLSASVFAPPSGSSPSRGSEPLPDSTPPPGSIVMIVGTNLPLSERQLARVARRCQGGLARVGSVFSNGSGDFALAFSTANPVKEFVSDSQNSSYPENSSFIRDDSHAMAQAFRACVEATEEAILNALSSAKTMYGRDGHVRYALPLEGVLEVLRKRPNDF